MLVSLPHLPTSVPLAILVTRDVSARYRGYLASVMPELAPGTYVGPTVTKAVRDRIWSVLADWWRTDPGGSVILAYPDREAAGGLAIRTLGTPPVQLVDLDGLRVVMKPPTR